MKIHIFSFFKVMAYALNTLIRKVSERIDSFSTFLKSKSSVIFYSIYGYKLLILLNRNVKSHYSFAVRRSLSVFSRLPRISAITKGSVRHGCGVCFLAQRITRKLGLTPSILSLAGSRQSRQLESPVNYWLPIERSQVRHGLYQSLT